MTPPVRVVRRLPLAEITIDDGTQARVELNVLAVKDYADAMLRGVEFPPVIVFSDGQWCWMADGFHRAEACRKAGLPDILAEVHPGSRLDAIRYAVSANEEHGVKRSHADKRHAIRLFIDSFPEWRSRPHAEIARACGVTPWLVKQVVLGDPHLENLQDSEHRMVRRGGAEYPMKIGGLRRSPRIPDEVLDQIRDSEIADDRRELRRFARLRPEQQARAAPRIASGEVARVNEYLIAERREDILAQQRAIESGAVVLPAGRYPTVVTDFPWPFGTSYDPDVRRAASPYPEMTIPKIAAVDLHAADDCVWFQWAPDEFLEEALDQIKQRCFRRVATIIWDKMRLGLGKRLRFEHEYCFVAIRGNPPLLGGVEGTMIRAPAGPHSAKPDAFFEKVTRLSGGPYLELFSRKPRAGWDQMGNDTRRFAPAADASDRPIPPRDPPASCVLPMR